MTELEHTIRRVKSWLRDFGDQNTAAFNTDLERILDVAENSVPLLKALARPVQWLPENKEDDVYLGSQFYDMDNDATPTLGECRAAHAYLVRIGELPPLPEDD